MNLRHLKIFIKVADYGSMTAAAEALLISQPSISQAISELESYYGTRLFERFSRRLYITDTGVQFLSYARHITTLFDEMEQAMRNPDQSGSLKIGATLTIGTCLLPRLVNEFRQIRPNLRVEAVVKNTRDIENLIRSNKVDLGLIEGIIHNPDMESRAFMDDELVLVCGRDHYLYESSGITTHELGEIDFVVREQGSGTRELFESTMVAKDIPWKIRWECNDTDALKCAAINGVGVAVISKLLVEKELKVQELSLIKVDELDLKRQFSIVYHKNKYITNSMQSFIDLCSQSTVNQGDGSIDQ